MYLALVKWKLRQLMADRRINNRVLAEKVDVHVNTISRWKLADEMPKIDGKEMERICQALDCSVRELLDLPDRSPCG